MNTKRPQILYLVHRFPYPPNRGDRIRSFHILDYLSKRADVHLATFADEPVSPESLQVLRDRCANLFVEPVGRSRWLRGLKSLLKGQSATEGLFWSRPLLETVRRWSRETQFDSAVVFCSSMGRYLDIPELSGVPTIVDLVDVDSEKFFQYGESARFIKRKLFQLEGRRLRRLESELTDRAKAVVLVSEPEAELWRSIYPNDHTYAVPNGVDLDYYKPAETEGRPGRCIFVGALDYPPNIDGVCWFAREVWPEVRRRCPTATFAIVGRNPHPDVLRLAVIQGVEVIGSVPDVRPFLAEASIAVAPLRIARGIQNKVLEAMACARPVIVSNEALQGLDAIPGSHLLAANSLVDWSAAILQLCNDVNEAVRIGRAGRNFVLKMHHWEICLADLSRTIPELGQQNKCEFEGEWQDVDMAQSVKSQRVVQLQ